MWKYSIENSTWTWIMGSNSVQQAGVYGSRGVPSISNYPGSRTHAIGWYDHIRQELWMFGGLGFDIGLVQGYLNDFWRFNMSSGIWTWMAGFDQKDRPGIYGTKGLPAASNIPSARGQSAGSMDASGRKIWLFGGYGTSSSALYGNLNDLWEFDLENATWTWVSGSNQTNQLGSYGNKGISSDSHLPGSRYSSFMWYDNYNGTVWVFGVWLNDLWLFSKVEKSWTWVGGSSDFNSGPSYGSPGTPALSNEPGARSLGVCWYEESDNSKWMFGGMAFNQTGSRGHTNEIWTINSFSVSARPEIGPALTPAPAFPMQQPQAQAIIPASQTELPSSFSSAALGGTIGGIVLVLLGVGCLMWFIRFKKGNPRSAPNNPTHLGDIAPLRAHKVDKRHDSSRDRLELPHN